MTPQLWRPSPTVTSAPFYKTAPVSGMGLGAGAGAGRGALRGAVPLAVTFAELVDQLSELGLGLGPLLGLGLDHDVLLAANKAVKPPPNAYLCHLCFKKGHYIKDCPQVCILFTE